MTTELLYEDPENDVAINSPKMQDFDNCNSGIGMDNSLHANGTTSADAGDQTLSDKKPSKILFKDYYAKSVSQILLACSVF